MLSSNHRSSCCTLGVTVMDVLNLNSMIHNFIWKTILSIGGLLAYITKYILKQGFFLLN